MPIKTLGSLGKIRVGRVTGNTHTFFFGLMTPIFQYIMTSFISSQGHIALNEDQLVFKMIDYKIVYYKLNHYGLVRVLTYMVTMV